LLSDGRDACLGVYADGQRDGRGIDARLSRDRAHRTHFEPEIGHARRRLPERNGTAHFGPFAPRRGFDRRIVADARLQRGHLLADRAINERLHLARQIDPRAEDRKIRIADIRLRGQVRLQPPVRQDRGPDVHRDVAAHVGALIERAAGQIAHLLSERFVQQAAERARDRAHLAADLRADLAGEAERAV
jgi:hypothetical protein